MLDQASAQRVEVAKAAPHTLVVVAEDDADMRDLIVHHLRRHGFDVEEAVDGDELSAVLQRLASNDSRPTVVLSDVHMPGRDGLQLLRESRSLLPHVPVLMMSASSNSGTRAAASELGAVAMLDKPLDLTALERLIHQLASA